MTDDELAGTGGGAAEGEGESSLAPPAGEYPEGHWPPWLAKLRNDFRSAKNAKANDGLISPQIDDPIWLAEPHADTAEILEAARLRVRQAEDRIATAEARAQRIAQTGLTLLTVAFLVAGFTANRLRSGEAGLGWWLIGALTMLPIVLLALTITQAISVDRVGYTHPAEPGPAARAGDAPKQRRNLIRQEMRAARMANWTAGKKVNESLQARAWLTRSIAAIIVAGVAASLIWLCVEPPRPPTPSINVDVQVPPTTAAASSSTAPTSTATSSSTTSQTTPPSSRP